MYSLCFSLLLSSSLPPGLGYGHINNPFSKPGSFYAALCPTTVLHVNAQNTPALVSCTACGMNTANHCPTVVLRISESQVGVGARLALVRQPALFEIEARLTGTNNINYFFIINIGPCVGSGYKAEG